MTTDHALDTIYALALLPVEPNSYTCLAARASGLYRSDDAGATWHSFYHGLQLDTALPTSALAVVQSEAGTTIFVGAGGGIMRSDDGGERWQVSMLSTGPVVTAIAPSPAIARDGVLFAATLGDGVLRSADAGATWSPWNFGLLDHQALCLAVSPDYATDETVYVGCETGVFRSANGGRSWHELPLPCQLPITCLALLPGDLFVGTEGAGLWRSADNGATWAQASGATDDATILGLLCSDEPSILAVTTDGVLVSTDGRSSWHMRTDLLTGDVEITCAAALPGVMALGFADGSVTMLELPEQKATRR